jgi:RimJ/RimL family protein N-acetyltransferase
VLRGEAVLLRAQTADDIPALTEIRADVDTWVNSQDEPYVPVPVDAARKRFTDRLGQDPPADVAWFAVQTLADGALVGSAGLWGLSEFFRAAHVGITLAPAARGRGVGTDVLRVLADYAFRLRGLHRLGLETLASNIGMQRAAAAVGFREEGRLREHAFVAGRFDDVVMYGLLAS